MLAFLGGSSCVGASNCMEHVLEIDFQEILDSGEHRQYVVPLCEEDDAAHSVPHKALSGRPRERIRSRRRSTSRPAQQTFADERASEENTDEARAAGSMVWVLDEPIDGHEVGEVLGPPEDAQIVGDRALIQKWGRTVLARALPAGLALEEWRASRGEGPAQTFACASAGDVAAAAVMGEKLSWGEEGWEVAAEDASYTRQEAAQANEGQFDPPGWEASELMESTAQVA